MVIDRFINFTGFRMKKIPDVLRADSKPCAQNLCSVAQLAIKHTAFTQNALRSLIYASKPRKRS